MSNDIEGWALKHLKWAQWTMVSRQWAWLSTSCKNLRLLLLCKSEEVLIYLNGPAGSFCEEIFLYLLSYLCSKDSHGKHCYNWGTSILQRLGLHKECSFGLTLHLDPPQACLGRWELSGWMYQTEVCISKRAETHLCIKQVPVLFLHTKHTQQIPRSFIGSYNKGGKTFMTHDRLKKEAMKRLVFIFVLKHRMHCNDRNILFLLNLSPSLTSSLINLFISRNNFLCLLRIWLPTAVSINCLNALKTTHFYKARFNTHNSPHTYLPMLSKHFILPITNYVF